MTTVESTEENKRRVTLFLEESNGIEGIFTVTDDEVISTLSFIKKQNPTIDDLIALVQVYQPDAKLRDIEGLDVRVGNHIAPAGGPKIRLTLEEMLSDWRGCHSPCYFHLLYEDLHPFTDGNGRTGRALWANQMYALTNTYPIGFLHMWYYQTLENCPRN